MLKDHYGIHFLLIQFDELDFLWKD